MSNRHAIFIVLLAFSSQAFSAEFPTGTLKGTGFIVEKDKMKITDKDLYAYLIIELENSVNVNQYTVFNPNVRSVAECNSDAAAAIPQILASAPSNVPRNSRVKSWRCSLIPPEKGG